jgi:uncharacterized membrane protein
MTTSHNQKEVDVNNANGNNVNGNIANGDNANGNNANVSQSNQGAEGGVAPFPPGVISSYRNGWHQLWKNILELFVIGIIIIFISLPFVAMSNTAEKIECAGVMLGFMSLLYGLLLINPLEYGVDYAYLKAARGDKLEIKDMFAVFQNYWSAVLAKLLAGIIIGIGIFLLIVPGIIFACRLAFVPYLVVDRKMETIAAIKESWRMTRGHANKVFLMGLLAIPIVLLGLICLVVGVIPAAMWIQTAFASLYHAVSESHA